MIVTCPSTPEWKNPFDLDLNGEAKQDDDDDAGDLAPVHVCIFSL
jgi:mRNA-capping enzyme